MKITRQTAYVVAALSALVFPLCATAKVPAVPAVEWDELTRAVKAVEAAGTFDTATAAYAKGCTINRRSSKLQLAYLKKTLQLGRPDVAQNAATELLEFDDKCGLALGTVAYMHARNTHYLPALAPAVKAAEIERDNKSIISNAAQLVAWYEAAKRGTVDADTRRTIKALPSSSKQFAADYKRAKECIKKLGDVKAKKDKEAQQALAEAEKVESEAKSLSDKLKSAGKTYDQQVKQLNDARRDLSRAQDDMNRISDYRSRENAQRRITSIYRRIRDIQRTMRQQEDAGLKIKKELEKVRKDAQSKRYQAEKITREAKAVAEGMPANFGWLPPAVDGVVTPDSTIAKPKIGEPTTPAPGSSYLVPANEPKPSAPKEASLQQRLAAAEAADKLQMAKLCTTSKDEAMKAKARELLKEIVAKFPATPSATEAKALLAKDSSQ